MTTAHPDDYHAIGCTSYFLRILARTYSVLDVGNFVGFQLGGYQLGVHSLVLFVSAIGSLGVGVRGIFAESETREDAYLFTISLILSLLLASQALMTAAPDEAAAHRWAKMSLFLTPFCPAVAYRFGLEMAGPSTRGKILNVTFNSTAAVLGLSVFGFESFLAGVRRTSWGWHFELESIGLALVVFTAAALAAGTWEVRSAFVNNPSGPVRRRARWFLVAMGLAGCGAIADFWAAFGWQVYPAGYLFFVSAGIITVYAIAKYNFTRLTPEFAAGQVFETLTDPVLAVDNDSCIRVVNDECTELFGYASEELVGAPVDRLSGEDITDERFRTFLGCGDMEDEEVTFQTADGEPVAMSVSTDALYNDDGKRLGTVIVARDIRDRKRAERALEKSRERYALAARGAHDGLWDWNVETDEVYLSDRWKEMLGYEPDEFDETRLAWFGQIHPDDRDDVEAALKAHLHGETDHFEEEYRIRHADGDYRWMLARGVAIRDEEGLATRMAGSQTDITDRKRAEEQLRHDAFHDALTDVPNRALFMDRLERALEVHKRHRDRPFSLLFLDLDRFKMINDSLGHSVGDELLKQVANRLQDILRSADTVARIGGDEFAVLLPDVRTEQEAREVAERCQRAIERPITIEGHELFASASIGILTGAPAYEDPEELLRDADVAMYYAKDNRGRDIAAFHDGMETSVGEESHLESDLRRGIEREELTLEYQPIVEVETSAPVGVEALVRWYHPEHGRVSPGEFIPLAEESGLIEPIGIWVRETACRQVANWQREGVVGDDFTVSVNLSPRELARDGLLDEFETLIERTAIAPHSLLVELTEEVLIGRADRAADVFDGLHDLGIRVCIDDFGTGYSSLSYLQQFPADFLKVDRDFITSLGGNPQDREIVDSILELAEKLELSVVAEGVETEEQLETIRELGVPYGQGYYWSAARPASDLFTDRGPATSTTASTDSG